MHRWIMTILSTLAMPCMLATCASSEPMTVNSRSALKPDLAQYHTFGLFRISEQHPKVENMLLRHVRGFLENKGLTYVNGQADFLVAADYYIGKKSEYVPPAWVPTRRFGNDRSGRRNHRTRSAGIRRTEADRMRRDLRRDMHYVPGYVDTTNFQAVHLYFVKVQDRETTDILWQGTVDYLDTQIPINDIASKMVDALMTEFPRKSLQRLPAVENVQ